ncbi:uncharacterized protein zgc:152951 [Polypterus senegalus]|uniref:uncharacterized protein zgc:152951 n=1 Tax=Polypterus senegalus TaxID=55291 RepID=UPI001965CFB8|nr:uncharacterized protein zgc:152951 [Polypterus senegalus]
MKHKKSTENMKVKEQTDGKEVTSTKEASRLADTLKNLITKLYVDHLSDDGKMVNYQAVASSPTFEKYCQMTIQLQNVQLTSLTRKEKLAFFINVYNALVIHGQLKMGSPKNMWQRYRFLNSASYLIGGTVFTLQDIENGVLRGNRKGTAQLLRPFSKYDPRLLVALPDVEPLIHFALNWGAKGCPPIKAYAAKDVDRQLRKAAKDFLETDDGIQVNEAKGEIQLNHIFKWYQADFGDTDEKVLHWIINHMENSAKKEKLKSIVEASSYKIMYLSSDWSSNAMD